MIEIQQLLDRVKTIKRLNQQILEAKGEVFNIYEILDLRTKEVRTHSSFIAELLNPQGMHLLGDSFLKVFKNHLQKKDIPFTLDIDSTVCKVEFGIGSKNNIDFTGGRIDIFLIDKNGHSITIENKIDATDQDDQLTRYCNYNQEKNTVIYLTKFGEEPSEKSIKNLSKKSSYYLLSYNSDIIKWLEVCQSIAYDQPILRESIKQYKILIQKITNTLTNQKDLELKRLVLQNLNEAELIANNYSKIINEVKNDFREELKKLLQLEFSSYMIETRLQVHQTCASLWFRSEELNEKRIWFGIESFSGKGHLDGNLFMGIYDEQTNIPKHEAYNKLNDIWVHHQVLKYHEKPINLEDKDFLKLLVNDKNLKLIAEKVAKEISEFVKIHLPTITNIKPNDD